jgi:hypothetical protein
MEYLKHRQLRGISPTLARGLCTRLVETRKSGGQTKLIAESKEDMKGRLGRSPDAEDAACILVDLVRERFRGGTPRTGGKGNSRGDAWRRLACRVDVASGPALLS